MPLSTIHSAMTKDKAATQRPRTTPPLDVFMIGGKCRMATEESVEVWVDYQIGKREEREKLLKGQIEATQCEYYSYAGAKAFLNRQTK